MCWFCGSPFTHFDFKGGKQKDPPCSGSPTPNTNALFSRSFLENRKRFSKVNTDTVLVEGRHDTLKKVGIGCRVFWPTLSLTDPG